MPEERRLVTVVFADVVGSTALGEQLDAEDMRAMLARYYAIAKEVVTAHGGTLEKFIGDAVMCVFGLPHAHDDDADRALSALLELRDRVRSEASLSDLTLRFGACSGEVVATREAGADFLVTGDAVNVAARLQQAAVPWAILASERTLGAVSGAFDLGPQTEVSAKGKSGVITAREVRAKLQSSRTARAKAAMRGRANELDHLVLAGRRAFRDRKPAFVTIVAPPGTGKSRLVEEFLARELLAIAPGANIAVAQCLPYGSQLTYWPLRQLPAQLAGIADDASGSEIREHLAAWLDNKRFADLLATSIGYGTDEAPDRADVFAAWRFALEKASNAQPLSLVFEDLHWASDTLLDLVDFVMQTPGEARILMLALSRPELIDRRPGWGGGRRNFSNLFLEPLSDGDMTDLVRDLLHGANEKSVEAVVARAGGNPFYAEEFARGIRERGDVERLPDTVQASIQARLDLLPNDERHVLLLGSIFGRTFRVSGIGALAPQLNPDLGSVVEGLLRRDLVRRDDDDHLTFVHILIRDVVYQAATRADRARLHAAAGTWLESRAQGRESAVAELVALHYREAINLLGRQRLVDFDERALRTKAVRWLALAGDAAGAAGATLEASRHFRAAIELAGEEQRWELYERLGDVEQLRVGSIDAYSKALELGRLTNIAAVDELRILSGLLMCVVRWAEGVGRFPLQSVERMLGDARHLASQVSDARSLARFHAVESFYPWHVRREGSDVTEDVIGEAEASGRRAAELAENAESWDTWSAAVDGVTSCLIEKHDWSAAREMAQSRVERQSRLSVVERMDAYHMVTQTSICEGDLRRAESSISESSSLLDLAQTPSLILALLGDRMYVLLLLGRWDETEDLGIRVRRVWTELREALGPARIGFVAGLEVARARRDKVRAAGFEEALRDAAVHAASGPLMKAYADLDPVAMERELLASMQFGWGRLDMVERLLSALNDLGHSVAETTADAVLIQAERWRIPLLKAQALRAKRDFAGAATVFGGVGAAPYEARAWIELALEQATQPDPRAVALLSSLGDVNYLESHQLGFSRGSGPQEPARR